MTPEQRRLADRIVKLLALASSTTFYEEADTARRMAEQLMKEHNINPGPGKPPQSTIEMRTYTPFAKGMRWEGMIAGSLANMCSCVIFFNSKKLDIYVLVGTIFNLDILEYMIHEMGRQRITAWLNYKVHGEDSFNKFCYGFAQALTDKIQKLVDEGARVENERKLVLWYERNTGANVNPVQLETGAASSKAGLEAGAGASLHRGQLGQPVKRIEHRKRIDHL